MTRRIVAAGVGAILAVRVVLALPGWYAADDLALKLQAWTEPFWQSVGQEHFGNLMPAGLAVDWLRIRLLPSYDSAAILAVVAMAVSAWLVWRLLKDLSLSGQGQAAGVLFFVITPLTAEVVFWWAAAMNFALFLPFVLVAIIAMVRYWDTRSKVWLIVAFVGQVFALAFFQKAILLPVWLLGVALLRRGGVRAARPVLLVGLATSVAYAAVYVMATNDDSMRAGDIPRLDVALQALLGFLGKQILPAIAGGPWTFTSVAGPSSVGFWLPGLLLGLVVAGLVLRALPGTLRGRAVVMVLLWLTADMVLLSLGRGADPQRLLHASDWTRYAADLAIPLAIIVGLAASAVALNRLLALGTVVTVCATLGWLQVSRIWWANPGRAWNDVAVASVAERPGALLSQSVPAPVLPPAWGLAASGRGYLAALVPDNAWLTVAPVSRGLNAEGRIGTSLAKPVATSTQSVCSAGTSMLMPLNAEVADGTWIVRLHFVSQAGANLEVRLSEWVSQPEQMSLPSGERVMYMSLRGAGDALRVTGSGPWCLVDAQVATLG